MFSDCRLGSALPDAGTTPSDALRTGITSCKSEDSCMLARGKNVVGELGVGNLLERRASAEHLEER